MIELTEEEKSKIESSLLDKVEMLNERHEKIEMFIEVETDPALDKLATVSEGSLTNEDVERILNNQIPEEIEIVKYYSFLNSFLVRCDSSQLRKIFQTFDVVKIYDASGKIKLMGSDQADNNAKEESNDDQSEKDQDNEIF